MAFSTLVSGLDRLVEAVEASEAAAAAVASSTQSRDGFRCPHPGCHRLFSKRYNQQAHMRIHDGSRPFTCNRCSKAFMWKSSLKSHAKMHAKLEAAEAAEAAATAAATEASSNAVSTPTSASSSGSKRTLTATGGVAKRKPPSPPLPPPLRPRKARVLKKRSATNDTQQSSGRRSPESVLRVDLDAAALLTTLR